MIKVGITGGIGSGKSVVSRMFQILGAPVYIADDEAKKLMITNLQIKQKLEDLLGNDVYKGGELNKKLLANYIFSDSSHADKINKIVHPIVMSDFINWCSSMEKQTIVGIESAILFEAGFENTVDYSILVYAPEKLRIERVMLRDQSSEEGVLKRIRAQESDEVKKTKADFIVHNNSECALLPQVLLLVDKLRNSNFLKNR